MILGQLGLFILSLSLSTAAYSSETTPLSSPMEAISREQGVRLEIKNNIKVKPRIHKTSKTIIPSHLKFAQRLEPIPVKVTYYSEGGDNDESANLSLRKIKDAIDYNQILEAFLAQPIADRFYQTLLFSTADSPYVAMSLHQKVTQDKTCENKYGPCVVFERDSASGQTVSTAYLVVTGEIDRHMTEDIHRIPSDDPAQFYSIYRIPIDDKKFASEISDILRLRPDGIYVYANSPEKAVVPTVESAPVLSLNFAN